MFLISLFIVLAALFLTVMNGQSANPLHFSDSYFTPSRDGFKAPSESAEAASK